jgi:hypothetical protein
MCRVGWLYGLIGAVALGAMGNLAYDLVRRPSRRLPAVLRQRRLLPDDVRGYDPAPAGLHHVVSWSKRRPLSPQNLETRLVGKLDRPHVLDTREWRDEVAAQKRRGTAGRNCYLVALDIDHHEHANAHKCRMTLAESDYAECLANYEIVRRDPTMAAKVLTLLAGDMDPLLAQGPPTSFFSSVAIISPNDRVLALRRSTSVRTGAQKWSIGINETMKYDDEPGREEDLFSLVRRGLKEEVGLESNEYGPIVPTWLGWSEPACSFVAIATVRTRVSEAEVDLRRGTCHSVYEHDAAQWIPLNRGTVTKIVRNESSPDSRNPWLYLAPLVISEVWRCRDMT